MCGGYRAARHEISARIEDKWDCLKESHAADIAWSGINMVGGQVNDRGGL
jgi:hypothetical protein